MHSASRGRSKLLFVLILAVIAAILWPLSLPSAYTDFQGARLTDPLAEVHSLSPLYYAALVFATLACVAAFVWRVRSSAVHLVLLTVLAAAVVVGVVRLRGARRFEAALAGVTALAFAGWFFWHSFHPGSYWKSAEEFYESLSPAQLGTGAEYVTGTKFIYQGIFALNEAVYFLYGAVGLPAVCLTVAGAFVRRTGEGFVARGLCGLKRGEAILVVSIPPLLVLTFLLAGRSHVLIETGLTYLVIAISCVVASIVVWTAWVDRGPGRASVALAALFLALTFPTIAYSIDAYSSFPRSEEAGLRFLAERGVLEGRTVATSSVSQLALYEASLPLGVRFVEMNRKGGYDLVEKAPDLVAFRSTGYYYHAMRFDMSFEDNSYNRELDRIDSSDYKKVYDGPTFHIYSR